MLICGISLLGSCYEQRCAQVAPRHLSIDCARCAMHIKAASAQPFIAYDPRVSLPAHFHSTSSPLEAQQKDLPDGDIKHRGREMMLWLILCAADAGRRVWQQAIPAAAAAARTAAAAQIHQAAVHRQSGRRGRHAAGWPGTLRQVRTARVLRCIKLDSKLGTLTLLPLLVYITGTSWHTGSMSCKHCSHLPAAKVYLHGLMQVQLAAGDEADCGRGHEFPQVDAADECRGRSAQPCGRVPPRRLRCISCAGAVLVQLRRALDPIRWLLYLLSSFMTKSSLRLLLIPAYHCSSAAVTPV